MSTSDRRYWVRPPGGRPTGPFKAVELRALASLGRVAPDDHVRDGEAGKWHLATQVKNLFGTAVLRAEAEKQLRKRLGGKVALPPVRRAAAARPAAGRDDATPRDAAKPRGEAYGGGGTGRPSMSRGSTPTPPPNSSSGPRLSGAGPGGAW